MLNRLLALLQNKLQKNAEGKVVILNGGVEQDLDYLSHKSQESWQWLGTSFQTKHCCGNGCKTNSYIKRMGGGQVNPLENGQSHTTDATIRTRTLNLRRCSSKRLNHNCWIRWNSITLSRWLRLSVKNFLKVF